MLDKIYFNFHAQEIYISITNTSCFFCNNVKANKHAKIKLITSLQLYDFSFGDNNILLL